MKINNNNYNNICTFSSHYLTIICIISTYKCFRVCVSQKKKKIKNALWTSSPLMHLSNSTWTKVSIMYVSLICLCVNIIVYNNSKKKIIEKKFQKYMFAYLPLILCKPKFFSNKHKKKIENIRRFVWAGTSKDLNVEACSSCRRNPTKNQRHTQKQLSIFCVFLDVQDQVWKKSNVPPVWPSILWNKLATGRLK